MRRLTCAHGHVVVVTVVTEVIVAAGVLIRRARHRRSLGHRFVHLDHQVTQHGIAEAE